MNNPRLQVCITVWIGGLGLACLTSHWPVNPLGNMLMGIATGAWFWRSAA